MGTLRYDRGRKQKTTNSPGLCRFSKYQVHRLNGLATAAGNSKGLGQRSADTEIGQRTNRKEVELLLKPQSLDMDEGLSSVWGLQHHNGGCPEGYGPFIDQC